MYVAAAAALSLISALGFLVLLLTITVSMAAHGSAAFGMGEALAALTYVLGLLLALWASGAALDVFTQSETPRSVRAHSLFARFFLLCGVAGALHSPFFWDGLELCAALNASPSWTGLSVQVMRVGSGLLLFGGLSSVCCMAAVLLYELPMRWAFGVARVPVQVSYQALRPVVIVVLAALTMYLLSDLLKQVFIG